MQKQPDLVTAFPSGIFLEVFITEPQPGVFEVTCQWKNYPPSAGDVKEYESDVLPLIAMKAAEMQKRREAQNN